MSRNAERNAEIIRRIKAGEAFPEIAAAMGISKNAVIGVCFRAGLSDPKRNAAATKANWQDPEFRERQAAAVKANWQDPEFRERQAAAVKAGKAKILCDKYGLHPEELDDFRAIKRGGVKPADAARMVIASRKAKAA